MGLAVTAAKPHAVCIPFPAQGHITPMLHLAKFLHSFNFHITFVNSEYNHNRLLNSLGPSALTDLPDFCFATIPDGLPPPTNLDATQDITSLCVSTNANCLPPFLHLLYSLTDPPVSCIVTDVGMGFALDAARDLAIPAALFVTNSACGFMGYLHYKHLMERGLIPLNNKADLGNCYLDTPVEFVPGMPHMRLRDFPTFIRTTNPQDVMLNFCNHVAQRAASSAAVALLFNTFDDLEPSVLDAMSTLVTPPIYTVGPLGLLTRSLGGSPVSVGSNLWKEDPGCIGWLNPKQPGSVVYVNFGSITVLTNEQLVEFAWGLANSGYDFLWVIRPDLVKGDTAVLPPELWENVGKRGRLASWCPQEEVLSHAAIGGFLTHCGWNSMMESICAGVPMLCWPFFAEQQTNCKYACAEWGIGMEIGGDVKRGEVEGVIRELMGGEKGKEMRRRAAEWKESAVKAIEPGGTTSINLEKLVKQVLIGNEVGK